MRTSEYEFTGFYPSGNPFSWYYDEKKHCMFTTSIEVAQWDSEPKRGDKITMIHDDDHKLIEVRINGKKVYSWSEESEKKKLAETKSIYDGLKRSKGFLVD